MRTLTFHVRYLSLVNGISVACFLAAAIFSWRAVSSISTGMMILSGFAASHAHERKRAWPAELNLIAIAAVLCFLSACSAALLNPPFSQHLGELRTRTALLFLPLACYLSFPLLQAARLHFIRIFCILCLIASAYCLTVQLINGRTSADYFYHALVHPIGQHAVIFSCYLFFAVCLILEDLTTQRLLFPVWAGTLLLLFFSGFILLLSSKLIIVICLIFYSYRLFSKFSIQAVRGRMVLAPVILAGILIILTPNAVHQRFREMTSGHFSVLQQDRFRPDMYFNAWQFRLLQFRLVPSILQEERAWTSGTGAGRTQPLLDSAYTQLHMYAGEPGTGQTGYLGYDTHDQWLQSLLEAGIPGLIAFSGLFASLLLACFKQRSSRYLFPVIALTAFSFTDAVLASQYGLLVFLFFPFFLWTKPGEQA